MLHLGHPI